MLQIKINGKTLHCEAGANLREVLIKNDMSPHNGNARYLNCFGLGTCGTCAVKIEGKVLPINSIEKIRLSIPPHQLQQGLRLSCQVAVNNDIEVSKGAGFWGQLASAE